MSGADPLNLVGILTPDARVLAIARNRVLFRDGVAIAALEGGEVRRLAASELSDDALRTAMMRRLVTPNPRPWLRTETPRERLMRSSRGREYGDCDRKCIDVVEGASGLRRG